MGRRPSRDAPLRPHRGLADLVPSAAAEANIGLPIRGADVGACPDPWSAAIHMARGLTRGKRGWRGPVRKCRRRGCWPIWRNTPQGPLWTQDLYGERDRWLGPRSRFFAGKCHPRYCAGGNWFDAGRSKRQVAELVPKDPCGECRGGLKVWDHVGAREAKAARHRQGCASTVTVAPGMVDDLCGMRPSLAPKLDALLFGRRVGSAGPPGRWTKGSKPLPRHGWGTAYAFLKLYRRTKRTRSGSTAPRQIRHDGHRPVSRLSARRWPRTVIPFGTGDVGPRHLPLGLHHRGSLVSRRSTCF